VSAWGDYPSRSPSLCPSPGERACLELVRNHYRSDGAIAQAARCSVYTVTRTRHLLEDEGVIGYIEASDRAARTRTPCADPLPFIPAIPPRPAALSNGTCVSHPTPQLWEATRNPSRRAQALELCQACPALQPCREWALSLSPLLDRQIGILGGLLVADRDRLRKARRQQAAQARTARRARRAAATATHPRPAKEAPRP